MNWTKAEDAKLREQLKAKIAFPKMHIEGRSLRAIESRAFHLGLKLGVRRMPIYSKESSKRRPWRPGDPVPSKSALWLGDA